MTTHRIQFLAYFHVGEDITFPQALVDSVRRRDPDVDIIQISPPNTPSPSGVSELVSHPSSSNLIMYQRLDAFATLGKTPGGLYVDTDMLAMKSIRSIEKSLTQTSLTYLCKRTCFADEKINPRRDIDVTELVGEPINKVFPYVACLTYTADPHFWQNCLEILVNLPPKYAQWYGDQAAMRQLSEYKSENQKIGDLFEHEVAAAVGCLPRTPLELPTFLHFKGAQNKNLLNNYLRWTNVKN